MRLRFFFLPFFCIALALQGCTFWGYIHPSPPGTFRGPCPQVGCAPFYHPDFGCIENLKRLTALRQRGVGVIVLGDRLRFILPADSVFPRDSFVSCGVICINECYTSTLANIAEIIKCIPRVPVVVTGHTDNVGPRPQRYRHSYAMAEAVAAHLWAQGVSWDRLRVVGRADCDPIASDLSVFGSSDNRRVEIRLDFSGHCEYGSNNTYCPDCVGE
jgi:outer membrane protein OmpA-like peptidoglycan-associated protein